MSRDHKGFKVQRLTPPEWIEAARLTQRDEVPPVYTLTAAEHLAMLTSTIGASEAYHDDEAERRHDAAEHMSDRELDWWASRAEDAETRMHERRQASADRRWVS